MRSLTLFTGLIERDLLGGAARHAFHPSLAIGASLIVEGDAGFPVAASGPHSGDLRRLVLAMKYLNDRDARSLACARLCRVLPTEWPSGNPLIVPVPGAILPWRNRHGNHVLELAGAVASHHHLELANALRLSGGGRQSGKSRRGRLEAADRFRVKRGWIRRLNGRNAIIIDDVLTTGGTMRQMAKALQIHGVSRVFGLVVSVRCNRVLLSRFPPVHAHSGATLQPA